MTSASLSRHAGARGRTLKHWNRGADHRVVTTGPNEPSRGTGPDTHDAWHGTLQSQSMPQERRVAVEHEDEGWRTVLPESLSGPVRADARARTAQEIVGVPTNLATDEPDMPDAMTRPGTRTGKRVAVLRLA